MSLFGKGRKSQAKLIVAWDSYFLTNLLRATWKPIHHSLDYRLKTTDLERIFEEGNQFLLIVGGMVEHRHDVFAVGDNPGINLLTLRADGGG